MRDGKEKTARAGLRIEGMACGRCEKQVETVL